MRQPSIATNSCCLSSSAVTLPIVVVALLSSYVSWFQMASCPMETSSLLLCINNHITISLLPRGSLPLLVNRVFWATTPLPEVLRKRPLPFMVLLLRSCPHRGCSSPQLKWINPLILLKQ